MAPVNPYNRRWRWWYDAIADRIIAHPEWRQKEIAADLQRHPNTISMIMASDTFKSYLDTRKREYKQQLDNRILGKTAEIAALGLDIIHESLTKRRDAVPLQLLVETTGDALDRLGFGTPKGPSVLIDQRTQTQNNNVTFPGVTQAELLHAQQALRAAESAKLVGGSKIQQIEVQNDTVPLSPEREQDRIDDYPGSS